MPPFRCRAIATPTGERILIVQFTCKYALPAVDRPLCDALEPPGEPSVIFFYGLHDMFIFAQLLDGLCGIPSRMELSLLLLLLTLRVSHRKNLTRGHRLFL